jgi:hypothetical protein
MTNAKGLIVYNIDIYSLPPLKAEALCDRVRDELRLRTPEGWKIVVCPVRHEGNKIQVFSFAGEEPTIVHPIKIDSKELIVVNGEMDRTEITDHVLLHLGAPVVTISDEVADLIEEYIDMAFEYEINKKKAFIVDTIKGHVKTIDGIVVVKND